MTTEQKEQENAEVMTIQEELDGSAVVDLPESIPSPQKEAVKANSEHEDDSDEADEAARAAEMAAGGEIDPDAEAIRAQKRAKRKARKEYHKQVASEKDMKLDLLTRQNQDLLERLSVLEKKTHGSDLARLTKAMEDQHSRILFAKQKMSEAIQSGNGELHASAQEMWFEARRQYEALEALKKRAVQPERQQTIQQPNPMVVANAKNWMDQNPWYDPNGRDADSRVAATIDNALSEEGWNPATREYWEEFDNRLQRYLPHRYTDGVEERNSARTSRPRNVVTGSGRENVSSSGGRNQFVLAPEQVRAMKDAGMWDDPVKRAKMIKRYAQESHNRV